MDNRAVLDDMVIFEAAVAGHVESGEIILDEDVVPDLAEALLIDGNMDGSTWSSGYFFKTWRNWPRLRKNRLVN